MGPDPGLNTVEAFIESGSHVLFVALAEKLETVTLPVVNFISPKPGVYAYPWYTTWIKNGLILEIVFNRYMLENNLINWDSWLRLYRFTQHGKNEINVQNLSLKLIDEHGISESQGIRYKFMIVLPEGDAFDSIRDVAHFLVVIDAKENNIVDKVTSILLDADCVGTSLTDDQFNTLWKIPVGRGEFLTDEYWKIVDPQNQQPNLPSGDKNPGGRFHAGFIVLPPEV